MIKHIIFLLILMLPMAGAQEEKYFVATFEYSDKGFTMTKVIAEPVDFVPAPYPTGDYKIQVKRADDSIANEQAFTPPQRGYIHDTVTDEGIKGEFVEQESIYLDFYLPYDPKAKEIVLKDDKGKTQAVIDVTTLSEEIADKAKQTLVPFILILIVLGLGFYFWKEQQR